MNCDEALLAISAALDGELSPAERVKLSEHLMSCESCRELAEDLRVLTEELGRSDQEAPPELFERVRRAVAEEQPTPKKRRPPYLRAVAAMLALCICLGGVSLFVSGHKGDSADSAGGAASFMFQAAPESREYNGNPESAEEDDCDTADAPEDGPEVPMEAQSAQNGASPTPMPSSAPAATATEEGNDRGGTAPAGESYDETSAGDIYDKTTSAGAAAVTPEEALKLVFQYLGGYETYPEAEQLLRDGSPPSYRLKTAETSSDCYLEYQGLYEDGQSHWFRLYEDVSEEQADHKTTLNWYIVSPAGEVRAEFPA